MADIYSQCAEVLIWLGEDEDYAAQASSIVDKVIKDARSQTDDLRLFREAIFDEDGWGRHTDTAFGATLDLKPLFRLYSSLWFERLWVIQEAVLAPRAVIYCGNISMPLQPVLLAARWISSRHRSFTNYRELELCQRAGAMWSFVDRDYGTFASTSTFTPSLVSLLVALRKFQASDPRDHVYGMLGLYRRYIDDSLPSALIPDYNKSLRTVLRDTTRLAMRMESSWPLELLAYLYHDSDDVSLPSWVPAWHHSWDTASAPSQFASLHKADDGRMPIFSDSGVADSDVLLVQGEVIDHVAYVSPVFEEADSSSPTSISSWFEGHSRHMHTSAFKDEIQVARILVADVTHDRQSWDPSECLIGYRCWREVLKQQKLPSPHHELHNDSTPAEVKAAEYRYAMDLACVHRRLFCTTEGWVGLGPRSMISGDLVAILHGCRWLVVLHPRDKEGHYDVRGEAYVDGVMFGELVRNREAQGIAPVEFHLH